MGNTVSTVGLHGIATEKDRPSGSSRGVKVPSPENTVFFLGGGEPHILKPPNPLQSRELRPGLSSLPPAQAVVTCTRKGSKGRVCVRRGQTDQDTETDRHSMWAGTQTGLLWGRHLYSAALSPETTQVGGSV